MQHDVAEKMLVVLLDDMIQHSLPRILAIEQNLKQGLVLSNAEVDFFIDVLQRVNHCHTTYSDDADCRVIFSSIAHLIFNVLKQALLNEQAFDESAQLTSLEPLPSQPLTTQVSV